MTHNIDLLRVGGDYNFTPRSGDWFVCSNFVHALITGKDTTDHIGPERIRLWATDSQPEAPAQAKQVSFDWKPRNGERKHENDIPWRLVGMEELEDENPNVQTTGSVLYTDLFNMIRDMYHQASDLWVWVEVKP